MVGLPCSASKISLGIELGPHPSLLNAATRNSHGEAGSTGGLPITADSVSASGGMASLTVTQRSGSSPSYSFWIQG